MLDRNINSIIYQSYLKVGEIAYQISDKANCGVESGKEIDDLWDRGITIYSILYTISNSIEVKNNLVYRLVGITEQEMNKLLSTLKNIAEITDYPVAPFIPTKNVSNIAGAGTQGPAGSNGVSAYIAVVFAQDNTGTGLTTTPTSSTPWIAYKTSNSPIPLVPSSFTGTWVNYFGQNGTNGTNGTNGQNVYPYVRYADDNTGSGFSSTPTSTSKYIAFLLSTTDLGSNPSSSLFTGLWKLFVGQNGTNGNNGTDGNTILYGSGAPSNTDGIDNNFYIDSVNWIVYGPKLLGAWPSGVSMIGPPGPNGSNGSNGINGTSSYIYIAWADDASGTGFTLTFSPTKNYIGFLYSNVSFTPIVTDFNGLWSQYRGTGDRWATSSATSITIGAGIQTLFIDTNLAYTSGQRVVIAHFNDEANRMEGYCRTYDPVTGQLSVNVDNAVGSGTYNVWQVNLYGVPVQVITTDSYFGEIYVTGGSGSQTLSTSYQKINQFDTNGDNSPGVTLSTSNSNIQPSIRGAYEIYTELSFNSGGTGDFYIQLFKNGTAMPGTISRVTLSASEVKIIRITTVKNLAANDIIDVRVKAGTGTPTFVLLEGRLGLLSTGSPGTPDFTTFDNNNIIIANNPNVVDSFIASLAKSVDWDYTIVKGTNQKSGRLSATWNGVTILYAESNIFTIGTIDVTLSAVVNAGNIEFRAITTSDTWEISGNRTLKK